MNFKGTQERDCVDERQKLETRDTTKLKLVLVSHKRKLYDHHIMKELERLTRLRFKKIHIPHQNQMEKVVRYHTQQTNIGQLNGITIGLEFWEVAKGNTATKSNKGAHLELWTYEEEIKEPKTRWLNYNKRPYEQVMTKPLRD